MSYNADQLKAIRVAVDRAAEVGGTAQAALMQLQLAIICLRDLGLGTEERGKLYDALGEFLRYHPRVVDLLKHHNDLTTGLAHSLRLLGDDKEFIQ